MRNGRECSFCGVEQHWCADFFHIKKDTFEEIQICRLLLKVFELGHILVRLVNAENHDERSAKEREKREQN